MSQYFDKWITTSSSLQAIPTYEPPVYRRWQWVLCNAAPAHPSPWQQQSTTSATI